MIDECILIELSEDRGKKINNYKKNNKKLLICFNNFLFHFLKLLAFHFTNDVCLSL